MKLYDRLKSKEALIRTKNTQPALYEESIEVLNSHYNLFYITLFEATTIFWIYYPLDVFCLTRFYDLFDLD
tara:strand:- start:1210 stop:1422 length:213 start_codon:yes stop_codon:yes gene_type:complete